MPSLSTGKIAEVMFEEYLDTFESQEMMLDKVDRFEPEAADLQNAGNVVWRTVEQHAPILEGFDLTGQETEIIEETYPSVLGTLKNDFVKQRIDDVRDITFWRRRGRTAGRRQASELNKSIVNAMVNQGSLHLRSSATSGYDFIAGAQAIMNERQGPEGQRRCFLLNDRDNLAYGSDLAARQTVQGRPEDTWTTGQIGNNVAQFDVYVGSFLPNLDGGASANTTVTGDQSFAPSGGTVNPTTQVVTNVDYREADIPVAASSGYTIGDKVRFQNPGAVDVNAIGLDDKTNTNGPMTFTIVDIPDATTVTVFPKPIAEDDPGLTTVEAAYANVDTQILNGALMVRLNTDTSVKTNLFWDMDAVEVLTGALPAELFKEFSGKRVVTSTMRNGQEMYMVYDGDINDLSFRYRLFTWYGITIRNPSMVGVATRWTAT